MFHNARRLEMGPLLHFDAENGQEEFWSRTVRITTEHGDIVSIPVFSNRRDALVLQAEKDLNLVPG